MRPDLAEHIGLRIARTSADRLSSRGERRRTVPSFRLRRSQNHRVPPFEVGL
jgi:hypothetical protein